MFGFIVGAAVTFGAIKFARRRHGGFGHRCHGPGRHAYGRGHRWRAPWATRGRGLNRVSDWLAHSLEATPEQYRVIRNELEQLGDKAQTLRGEFRLSRDDIAAAMGGESFDEERMGESFARQDDRIREVREQMVGALARIHDVLDPRQRERLAHLSHGWGRAAW